MEQIDCLICKNSDYDSFAKVEDRFKKKSIYNLVKCKKCNFVYLNPRPNKFDIIKHYDHHDYLPHNKNIFISLAQSITFRWKYYIINKFIKFGKIIDIGGGKGEFCNFMIKNGWKEKIYMYESSSKKTNHEDNYKLISSYDDFFDDSIKIITMWHSLEHLHDINDIMKFAYKILDNDGYIFVAVPNLDAYERSFLKEKWIAYDAPRHLYHFTPNTIERFFTNFNFKLVKQFAMYQDSIFNILLSLKPLSLKKIIYFIFLIFITYFKILINNKSASSILYVFKK